MIVRFVAVLNMEKLGILLSWGGQWSLMTACGSLSLFQHGLQRETGRAKKGISETHHL